jgi:enamine deaminase RidA (YjgF/YER057c/UK114 family)
MRREWTFMSERVRAFTGAPWEPIFGYCRALRVGNVVEVSGTTAMKDGQPVGVGDPVEQTKYILQLIQGALEKVGAKLEHVTRTRVYVTDISHWEQIGKVHGDLFRDIMPVCSMVEVKGLIHPDLLVEIEAQAIID